ncbi:MAG: putative amino acid-binding ACT domain protein [Chitinophagales bacterium]|jgi:predicted amino acid-binding ACT domain protein
MHYSLSLLLILSGSFFWGCKTPIIDYRDSFVGTYEGICYDYQISANMDSNGVISATVIRDTFPIIAVVSLAENSLNEILIKASKEITYRVDSIQVKVDHQGNFHRNSGMGANTNSFGSIKPDSINYYYKLDLNTLDVEQVFKASRIN